GVLLSGESPGHSTNLAMLNSMFALAWFTSGGAAAASATVAEHRPATSHALRRRARGQNLGVRPSGRVPLRNDGKAITRRHLRVGTRMGGGLARFSAAVAGGLSEERVIRQGPRLGSRRRAVPRRVSRAGNAGARRPIAPTFGASMPFASLG